MPDLSEMLGDVYGADEEPAQPAAPTSPGAPGWSDDEHLDKAFADWTPGPGADAPAAERGMFAPAPPTASPRLADDLAAALSEAVMAESNTDDDTENDEVEHDEVERPAVAETPAPAPVFEPVTEPVTASALTELEPEPEPAPIPVPVHKAGWQRSDDDILPTGKVAKGGVRLPRARAGKAPKAGKPDAGPKKQRRSFGDLMKMEIGGKKKK